jgi:hypothetical protein
MRSGDVQMLITVGKQSAALWDSQSGTHLGNIYTSGVPNTHVDAHKIDSDVGVQVDGATNRAYSGATGAHVPPLGSDLADTMGPEQHAMSTTINKMSSTAAAVTTAAAKKCVRVPHVEAPLLSATLPALPGCTWNN